MNKLEDIVREALEPCNVELSTVFGPQQLEWMRGYRYAVAKHNPAEPRPSKPEQITISVTVGGVTEDCFITKQLWSLVKPGAKDTDEDIARKIAIRKLVQHDVSNLIDKALKNSVDKDAQ